VAGSNYDVNIKLDVRTVNAQLKKLETRIANLNRIALGGRASKQILAVERNKLALNIKENRLEKANLKIKAKELATEKEIFRTKQKTANIVPRQSGGFNRGATTGGSAGGSAGGKGVLSGALISGAFPLLFGQGALGAAAGFGGGLIGGAIGGQMGGFAGGLVATALLQTVTNTVNGINELGAALNDPAQNLDKLVTNLSRFDRGLSTSVQILQSAGLTQSAGQLARANFGSQFGAAGANSLEEMNKSFKNFGKVTAELGTQLAILASGPLTGFMKMLNFVLGGGGDTSGDKSLGETLTETIRKRELAIEEIQTLEKGIADALAKREKDREILFDKEKFREASKDGTLGGIQSRFRNLGAEVQANEQNLTILKDQVKNYEDIVRLTELQRRILKETEMDLLARLELEKARFEGTEEELIVLEQRAKIKKLEFGIEKQIAEIEALKEKGSKAEIERAEQTLRNLELQLDLEEQITLNRLNAADPAISRMRDLNKEMTELNDLSRQSVELSKRMGSSFEDSFKGIVKGTMTVQDAFRNMLNRIADFFLDTAAQMAANQLQKSILGMFGNIFNFSTTPMNDIQGTVMMAANGGPVGMRQPYIVGERGPELFVPNQSGNIIPNHDLAGVGGGSTNIVVNVDASGSSVEGDEDQGRELGRLISVAVQSELIQQQRPGGLLA